jgi:hypothetical protein
VVDVHVPDLRPRSAVVVRLPFAPGRAALDPDLRGPGRLTDQNFRPGRASIVIAVHPVLEQGPLVSATGLRRETGREATASPNRTVPRCQSPPTPATPPTPCPPRALTPRRPAPPPSRTPPQPPSAPPQPAADPAYPPPFLAPQCPWTVESYPPPRQDQSHQPPLRVEVAPSTAGSAEPVRSGGETPPVCGRGGRQHVRLIVARCCTRP